ncbi:MAG: nitroreductase family protein [Erysipelotrichaceae bacterium]|nr:nitroreductase family protein [Erysipelotrichaceae bacterium]
MNEVIKQLIDRKSVRSFTDQVIDEAIVEDILMAAIHAPTAGNQQLYSIIRIKDQAIKEALVETCDHQPFIAKAPLVLLFCADCLKWYRAYEAEGCKPRRPGVGDLMIAVDDALIAAQNAVTAAWSYGIGSCYIGDIMENAERQKEILKLPEYVFPAALVVFGYPTLHQQKRIKPARSPIETIVFDNYYPDLSDEDIKNTLSCKTNGQDYHQWIQAFYKRKYDSDFSKEMTRSVSIFLDDYVNECND